MKRLAIVAVFGVIALAQLGLEQHSSGASGAPSSSPSASSGRVGATSVDRARRSLPLPRAVAVAPVDEARLREARVVASREAAARAARTRPAAGPSSAGSAAGAGVWSALAACESGGNPQARSANGRYFGAFQFSVATWQSLGYDGNPADHPYATQLQAAQRLQARAGWDQWPRCSRRLGLR
jgi:hypothetical protein